MKSLRSFAMLSALVLLVSGALSAQSTPIQRIRENPQGFVNQTVTVDGKVVRYVDATGAQFYFEDNFGAQIRVVSSANRPPIESRCSITGTIALEGTGDPYVVEQTRTGCGSATAADDADADGIADTMDRCPGTPAGTRIDMNGCAVRDMTPYYLAGGVLLVAILGFGIYRATRKPEPVITPPAPPMPMPIGLDDKTMVGGGAPAGAGDEDFFNGATIRFTRPNSADGTLKLVPGRLEVVAGPDKGNELRFVKVGTGTPEVTFGRSEGPKYTHVQLTARTVSRRHAIMRYDAGAWAIANFSETNPVVVNGDAMSAVGVPRTLNDGDVIEFGEVTLKFHAR